MLPIVAQGVDFAVQPSATGSALATVNGGQSAIYSLQVEPNQFLGTVFLSCSGAVPYGSSCAVGPSNVQVTSNSPVPFQVTLTTLSPSGHASISRDAPRPMLPQFVVSDLLHENAYDIESPCYPGCSPPRSSPRLCMRLPIYVAQRFMWRSLRNARKDAPFGADKRHIT
jgi:hypothetical protein